MARVYLLSIFLIPVKIPIKDLFNPSVATYLAMTLKKITAARSEIEHPFDCCYLSLFELKVLILLEFDSQLRIENTTQLTELRTVIT